MSIARELFMLLAGVGAAIAIVVYASECSKPITVVEEHPLPPEFVPVETSDGKTLYRKVQPVAAREITKQYKLSPREMLKLELIRWAAIIVAVYITAEYVMAVAGRLRGRKADQKALNRVNTLVTALLAAVAGFVAAPNEINRVPVDEQHAPPPATFRPAEDQDAPAEGAFAPLETPVPRREPASVDEREVN